MFVQVSVQILILLLSKKYTETPTTGGFETIFDSSGAFGMILYLLMIILKSIIAVHLTFNLHLSYINSF